MSTLFAFLHHVAAFTLVSALAAEFILIGQEFSPATARRLVITDAVLGASAGILLVVGLLRVFFFENARRLKPETFHLRARGTSSRPYGMAVLAVFDSNWRQQAKRKFIPKRVVA
jgi:Predicted membrane protein (DUF2214)